jgi:hypothetical protein
MRPLLFILLAAVALFIFIRTWADVKSSRLVNQDLKPAAWSVYELP